MKDLIKVRIDKCDTSTFWWFGQIGSEINVREYGNSDSFEIVGMLQTIYKSDCTVITEKEEQKPEPVLIAKAGEKVKIVDFGKGSAWSFTLNKPYELREDLYFGGPFRVIEDDRKGKNGFSPIPEGMKFEKVFPMEEHKQPYFIENPPIGLMPEWRHKELRINSILEAMHRYHLYGKDIPNEWNEEFFQLIFGCTIEVKRRIKD